MQHAFADLPRNAFPLTITYINANTNEAMESVTVEGPGALNVPARGVPTDVRIEFGNGETAYFSHEDLP